VRLTLVAPNCGCTAAVSPSGCRSSDVCLDLVGGVAFPGQYIGGENHKWEGAHAPVCRGTGCRPHSGMRVDTSKCSGADL